MDPMKHGCYETKSMKLPEDNVRENLGDLDSVIPFCIFIYLFIGDTFFLIHQRHNQKWNNWWVDFIKLIYAILQKIVLRE